MPTLVTAAIIACAAAALVQWRRRRTTRRFFARRYRDPSTLIPDGGGLTALCLLVAAVAMGGAALMARPDRATHSAATTLCILLDCSPSMLAAGRSGPRLAEAKKLVTAIMDDLPGYELCLVSFAGNAMVDFPPSHDCGAFRRALAAVEPSLALAAGSSPSQALLTVEGLLRGTHQQSANTVLIMLSDGEINDPQPLLQDIPWIARTYPLLHVIMGIPGQDTPVPGLLGSQWLSDPDSGALATSRADDQALKTLAALSPQPAEFYSAADHATTISARIRQLARNDGNSSRGRHAARVLGLIALAVLLVAMLPRRPTRARHSTSNGTARHDTAIHGAARHDTAIHGRRASAVFCALLALLILAGSATADDVPASLYSNAAARADAMAGIRDNIAREGCDGAERARLLSNWSALLVVEAEAAIGAGAPDVAIRHATVAREIGREALQFQPGNAATLQTLAAAWRVLQEAKALSAMKDGPSDIVNATRNAKMDRTDTTTDKDPGDIASTDARSTANADSKTPGVNATTDEPAATGRDHAASANASANEAGNQVGTWRDLQLQRHYRPPRPPGVKPW